VNIIEIKISKNTQIYSNITVETPGTKKKQLYEEEGFAGGRGSAEEVVQQPSWSKENSLMRLLESHS
jgi:hypothetical protein